MGVSVGDEEFEKAFKCYLEDNSMAIMGHGLWRMNCALWAREFTKKECQLFSARVVVPKLQSERDAAIDMLRECVEALGNFKNQVENHGGDYLPGNAKQMFQALESARTFLEKGK